MKTIDGKRMKEMQEAKKMNCIDVDPADDFKKNHIKGAASIPHSEKNFVKEVEKRFSKKDEEIVLCANNRLEPQLNRLSKELEQAGYKKVYQYKGTPTDWKNANLSIQKSA